MKCWALCLAALGLVWGSVGFGEAHIMTPDFVRQANSEAIATHEKAMSSEGELRQDEKVGQQLRSKKKEMEESERLEKKAMENMSEDKLKELKQEKKEAEKRAEMKELHEKKRLEMKYMMKSDFGFSTELKSAKKLDKKSQLLAKRLKKDKFQKQLLEKEVKKSKSLQSSKVKHSKKSASVRDEKKKLSKSLSGKMLKKRSTEETILKHAPEYMKLGRNIEEKRTLKKLRMRMKREAEALPYASQTKAFLSMRPAGKVSKHSEEDQDYWSNEQEYIKKDADESLATPDEDYNEVEGGDYPLEEVVFDQEEPVPVTSSPEVIDVEEEEEIPNEEVSSEIVSSAAPDIAENEIIPVTEADLPDYVPTSSAALVSGAFTQPPAVVTSGLSSSTPDIAVNEIIPVTEAAQPEIILTTSPEPIAEASTQPPILVTTGVPNSEIPETVLPAVDVSSSEVHVPETSTSPPVPTTSQAPVVSTVEVVEPESATAGSVSSSAEPASSSSATVEPAVLYEEPDNQDEPDLRIVTLAPEVPSASLAPLLATFEATTTTSSESLTTTETLPLTTTKSSGSWPWQNLGPNEESQCGQARFGPETRVDRGQRRTLKILDGKEALPGSFPWQVAILDKDRDMLCGGTLIAPRWVMTAAHCVRKKLFVRLSEHHINDKDGYEIEQKVRRVFRHPDYNSSTIDNDIALLRLPALPPFPDSPSGHARVGVTARACLPADQHDFPPVGTRCLVMGWGKASTTHAYGTDVLMYTRLPIISRKACIRANRKTITENMFCAGHYKGGSDTCSGDSGGPLLCGTGGAPSEETWTVYGVTSFGDGCGNAGKMGVYAKVNNYLEWMAGILSRY